MSALELTDLAKSSVDAANDSDLTLGTLKLAGSTAFGTVVGIGVSVFCTPLVGAAVGFAAGKLYEEIFDWVRKKSKNTDWGAGSESSWVEGDPFTGMPWPGVDPLTNKDFRDAKGWRQPVDPLMLDLDGDGLELRGANGAVLFDHDADGIRTGTGWISADDGILVRDVSGNGLIDSGRELFGVDTLKRNGQRAVNGFDALADLDSNADGNFTSADAAWNEVKVAIK